VLRGAQLLEITSILIEDALCAPIVATEYLYFMLHRSRTTIDLSDPRFEIFIAPQLSYHGRRKRYAQASVTAGRQRVCSVIGGP